MTVAKTIRVRYQSRMWDEKQDVYTRVTATIVKMMEQADAQNWERPWIKIGNGDSLPVNALTRKPYRGSNTLALWAAAQVECFSSNEWGSYKQWGELGAQVMRGQKGNAIVFWKIQDRETEDAGEDAAERKSIFARTSIVFNADQVTG